MSEQQKIDQLLEMQGKMMRAFQSQIQFRRQGCIDGSEQSTDQCET